MPAEARTLYMYVNSVNVEPPECLILISEVGRFNVLVTNVNIHSLPIQVAHGYR